MEQAEEIKQLIDGYWKLITIITSVFGAFITLLIYIYKQNQKGNDERHERTEETLKIATDNQTELKVMVASHEERIKRNKEDIRDNRKQIAS